MPLPFREPRRLDFRETRWSEKVGKKSSAAAAADELSGDARSSRSPRRRMKRRAAMDSHNEQQPPPKSLKIHVKMMKTFTLNVNCTDTVDQIKSKLRAIEGIDKSKQEMFFAGMHLKNEDKLADYNIMTNSSVDLYVTDAIQISVKIPSVGKTTKLNMRKSNSIADVKAEIEQEEGIPMNEQILMYAGQQLEDNHLLSQCHLRNDQTFHVLVCPNDKLHVFINIRGEKTIGLEAKRWYTVADVKLMIETLEGLPAYSQILTRMQSGVCVSLADSQMLQDQHVNNNDTLLLQQNVNFFVKIWEGKTLTMVLKMSDTGKEIMDRLEEKLQIKGSLYYLYHMGRVLSPEDTLQDHEVENNSTIFVRFRMI